MNYLKRKHERNLSEQQYKELMDSAPIHKEILDENWDIIQSGVLKLVNNWRGWNLTKIKKERVFIVPRIKHIEFKDANNKWDFKKEQTGWDLVFYNKSTWDFLHLGHHDIWKGTVLQDGFKAYQRQTKLDSILDDILND